MISFINKQNNLYAPMQEIGEKRILWQTQLQTQLQSIITTH